MFKIFVAVLLATSTASAAALAHGSMVGPCGPISPKSLANAELFVTPANAIEPARHTSKHPRRHGEHS
jgi:hypothetical protein